jgi:hypothetical protein
LTDRPLTITFHGTSRQSICGIFFSARIKQVMGKPAQAIAKFKLVTERKDVNCNNIANIW